MTDVSKADVERVLQVNFLSAVRVAMAATFSTAALDDEIEAVY